MLRVSHTHVLHVSGTNQSTTLSVSVLLPGTEVWYGATPGCTGGVFGMHGCAGQLCTSHRSYRPMTPLLHARYWPSAYGTTGTNLELHDWY